MTATSVKAKKAKKIKKLKVHETAKYFTFVKNIVNRLQEASAFYAFLNAIFWLIYIIKVVDKQNILFIIFKPSWDFISNFYTFKPSKDGDDLDFTGFLCTVFLIVVTVILKSVSEFVSDLEENAKIRDLKEKERAEKRLIAQKANRLNAKREAQKASNCEFIFLLDINISQASGFIQGKQLSMEEMVKLKNNFNNSILSNINANQINQKGYYKQKLFITYKSLNYFDDFIYYLNETLNSLLVEFNRPALEIDFYIALSDLKDTDNLKAKLGVLDTICKLKLKYDFICTSTLKELYEALPKCKYNFISKGVYNLSTNLNVSNNEEIYSLRQKSYEK